MKKLVVALTLAGLTLAHTAAIAQENKTEPKYELIKEDVKKTEALDGAKKNDSSQPKKDSKKKVKKGGC